MKKKKEHRHKWDSDGDMCENCGSYMQYCIQHKKNGDRCDAYRLCDVKGKCERMDI